jgi:uncharacterized protein (TIGR02996 family)
MTTNAALEQAIEANLDDVQARSVLADWYQQQGDPRGELIALQIAGNTAKAEELLAKHADRFLGKLAAHQLLHDGSKQPAFTWKYGFIHAARLSHNYYAEKIDGKLVDVLRELLVHPSARFLAEIALTFNNDPNEDSLQDLIDLLAEQLRPTLRKLHIGDFKYAGAARDQDRGDDTEISWYSAGDLGKLWAAVPRLHTLIVQTGSAESAIAGGTKLGTLALPKLRHFEYRTGGLEKANFDAIAAIAAPAIEHLDVWIGSDSYGCDLTADDVGRLLARGDLSPRHLGVMNCAFVDELVPALARSPMLPKLAELDLSLGCLTDEGAEAMAKHKDAFAHLELLDVSHSYLTGDGIATLRGCGKRVVSDEQRDRDGDDRYTAVGE